MPLIKHLPKDALVIYDRGYASFAIVYLHLLYGTQCIVRLPSSFDYDVSDFVQSGEPQRIIHTGLKERSARAVRNLGHAVSRKDQFPVRLIRVDLPTGEIEILMTTLVNTRRFRHSSFGKLYRRRWGIETSIFVLKSYLQAAVFASYTLPGVAQELWAIFAMYNVQTIFIEAQKRDIKAINQKRFYDYQVNRNMAAGLIKRFYSCIFSNKIKAWYAKLKCLIKELFRYLEPIRPRKNRQRKRKILRGTERHIYESNYKSTL